MTKLGIIGAMTEEIETPSRELRAAISPNQYNAGIS